MEAIAMKMTQEEFDSIKNLLDDLITNITSFGICKYLMTDFYSKGKVSNSTKNDFRERKVYEYFDRDIFLKACDIEVEKVWDVSEMQYQSKLTNEWIDCIGENSKFRFKPQPDYSKEIESLQDKAKENGMKAIIAFEKI